MARYANAVSRDELDRQLRGITGAVRLSGSAGEAAAFDYIQGELDRIGYRTERYLSDALIGYPRSASLQLLSPEYASIAVNGYSLSPRTSDDGVTGELVHVGSGGAAEYAEIDAAGKIVVSDGLAMPAKAMAARAAGAIGHIHVNDEHFHEMCISPVWGTPIPATGDLLPTVPSVAVLKVDGDRLKALMSRSAVTVRLVTQPIREWTQIPTLTAELPGNGDDGYVMFSGHVDSWHYGVMDNGTANATQVEVGRILAEGRNQLHRGVRLAFWSGHSHGRYAGSAWYADAFWHDLHERCACHVNVDSVGGVGASVLEEAPAMAETYAFGAELLREMVDVELDYRRISRSSDQSFWGHGIPILFASLSEQERNNSATGSALAALLGGGGRSGGLGWWWHTTGDTYDKIDADNLVRDADIYAETMWRLCTRERLPFDPAAGAAEIGQAAAKYHDAAGGAIDLSRTAEAAAELAAEIRALDLPNLPAARANALVHDLTRTLIPVNYTRNGPFEQDLALGSAPVPGLSDAAALAVLEPGSDAFFFQRTKLERDRNRVEHALRSAQRRIARP